MAAIGVGASWIAVGDRVRVEGDPGGGEGAFTHLQSLGADELDPQAA
jgi:hypothetical protein